MCHFVIFVTISGDNWEPKSCEIAMQKYAYYLFPYLTESKVLASALSSAPKCIPEHITPGCVIQHTPVSCLTINVPQIQETMRHHHKLRHPHFSGHQLKNENN